MMEKKDIETLLHMLADKAGAVQVKHWRHIPPAEFKHDKSPVTIADKETEQTIRQQLKKYRPSDGILGEEFGNENLDKEFVWVIDPIDGTKGFMAGGPIFTSLIALCQWGKPIAGVIDQPILQERYVGLLGDASTLNGKTIKTRQAVSLDKAIGFFSAGDLPVDETSAEVFRRLKSCTRIQRSCYDSYAYSLLAAGFVDVICETKMSAYDYMALVPVVLGAGGVITDWQGDAVSLDSGGDILAAGSKELHQAALEIILAVGDR
ncbi:MAG: inositol monophosphatase family protein [Alphaproteobacteria bacterium]